MVNTHNHLMFSATIISKSMTRVTRYTLTGNRSLRGIRIKVGINYFIDINNTRPSSNIMSMITHIFRSFDTKLSSHLVRVILARELYYLFPALKILGCTD